MTPDISYRDTEFAVPEDFDAAHTRFWQRLAHTGTWWNASERIKIAAEGRKAANCRLCRESRQALSPNTTAGNHDSETDLPDVVIEVIHRVMTDSSRLSQRWYQSVLDRGLTPEQYVEILGTLVALKSIDSFTQALGLTLHPLPRPQDPDTQPSHYRPNAVLDDAWVPLIPADANAGPEADLWPSGMNAYVIRAMSLVPDEVRTLNDLGAVHYLPNEKVGDPTVNGRHLSRAQIELVAGRVSALNQCFY